ncbi:hypothetical protein Vi05172_g2978 [Venturia inaequalis]|nr:hypothetical protein Vi05172_g2978 [Venturia inaequalis]
MKLISYTIAATMALIVNTVAQDGGVFCRRPPDECAYGKPNSKWRKVGDPTLFNRQCKSLQILTALF